MWYIPKLSITELLVCAFIAIFSRSAVAEEKREGDPHGTAEFAAASEGYRSNREAFEFFSCRYIVSNGKAKSIQDAMDGKFIDLVAAEHRWLVNKKNVKYEVTGDQTLLAAAFAKPRVGNTIGLPFSPKGRLTDGVIQMGYSRMALT